MRTSLTFILLLLTVCSGHGNDTVAAVQETVFRYQFEKTASVVTRAGVYFLNFSDPLERKALDPSDDFLRRFAGSKPRVAKFSEANWTDAGWWIDKKTDERGIVFFVQEVRILDSESAEVTGGYMAHSRNGAGYTYRLRRDATGWRVIDVREIWVS